MSAKPCHCRKYRQDLKKRAWRLKGQRCFFCNRRADHMAHVAETGLSGAGRGMQKRYRDVLKHPEKYEPMCKACHKAWDELRSRFKEEEPIPF